MLKPIPTSPPTFWRILNIDYFSTFAWVSVATVWGLLLIFKLFEWHFRDENFYLIFCGVVSVAAIGLTIWRQLTIRRLFREGLTAQGKVVGMFAYRDRAQFRVEYVHKGIKQKVQASCYLHNVRRVRKFREGDLVTLRVDPRRPRNVLIEDAYLD